jgi:TolA-binding protein
LARIKGAREISGLRFGGSHERLHAFMQAQETTATDYLFKLWPWFEANAKRIAYAAALALVVIFIYSFYSYRQGQRETAAGEALTRATMSATGGGLADACLKIAADYSGTAAGQRALLLSATSLFTAGKYADAQAQFQKFLDAYPDNFFSAQAALGLATSLDAQGKTDQAVGAYQKAAGQTADNSVAAAAKFALARLDEAQGKSADALKIYAELARTYPNISIGEAAAQLAMQIRMKSPAAAVAPAPVPASAAPFNLSH